MGGPPVGGGAPTGGVRVWNRAAMEDILKSQEEQEEGLTDEEVARHMHGRSGDLSDPQAADRTRGPIPGQRRLKNVAPIEAAQDKMRLRRAEDQKGLRERAERVKQVREQRFERLLEDLLSQDELKCGVASMIRHQSQQEFKKQANIYGEWNEKVFGKIQGQTSKYLNPPDRGLSHSLRGSKSVAFMLPGEQFRPSTSLAMDPAKRLLHSAAEEEAFRRTADGIISGRMRPMSTPPGFRQGNDENADHNQVLGAALRQDKSEHDLRGTSRPTLEPWDWGQVRLQGTVYGHFAQAAEASTRPGILRTQLKQGNGVFIPSEADGIPTAGKRRTRFERNDLGILKGEFAKRGETIQFKEKLGGGSGVLAQDHFLFEAGARVTNNEFPLGKKMFTHMH